MQGQRIYPTQLDKGLLFTERGQYGVTVGTWWAWPPKGEIGTLDDHEVTEHADGTISVLPSIDNGEWHGYLSNGVWSEA